MSVQVKNYEGNTATKSGLVVFLSTPGNWHNSCKTEENHEKEGRRDDNSNLSGFDVGVPLSRPPSDK